MHVFAEKNSRQFSAFIGLSAVGIGVLFAAAASTHWRGLFPDTRPTQVLRAPSARATHSMSPFDPERSITLALRETDQDARTHAAIATLRTWAQHDPENAAAWIQAHASTLNFTDALTEVIASMSGPPQAAVSLVESLARKDPDAVRADGYALIFGLDRRGEFSASADYAVTAPASLRRDLLIAAYHDWGRQQPENALLTSARIQDAVTRQIALQSALSGWARTDPEGLAGTALNFPDGAEKTTALTKALRAWMIKDPWKAGDWILEHHVAIPAAEAAMRKD